MYLRDFGKAKLTAVFQVADMKLLLKYYNLFLMVLLG